MIVGRIGSGRNISYIPGWTSTIFAIDYSQWLVSHDWKSLRSAALCACLRYCLFVQLVFDLKGHFHIDFPSDHFVGLDDSVDGPHVRGVDAFDGDARARDC